MDLPDVADLRAEAHVVSLPLVTRFRGVDHREALLLRGPGGWTEFSPFLEYDDGHDYLKSLSDPMDQDGFVHVPDRPGLGEDIDFDFIENNRVS